MTGKPRRRTYWARETWPISDASPEFIRDGGLGLDDIVRDLLQTASKRGNRVDLNSLKVTVTAEPLHNPYGPLVLAAQARVEAITTQ